MSRSLCPAQEIISRKVRNGRKGNNYDRHIK